jgi:hypothetical protein
MIDNPYLALCPCCGEMICLKCVEIDERLGELCGCDECNARQQRLEKRQADHLAKYDHVLLIPAAPAANTGALGAENAP